MTTNNFKQEEITFALLKMFSFFNKLNYKEVSVSPSLGNIEKLEYNELLNEISNSYDEKDLTPKLLNKIIKELEKINGLYYTKPGINVPIRIRTCDAQEQCKKLLKIL